jgi:hypothetical protein
VSANLRVHSKLRSAVSEQPVLYLSIELGWDAWKLAFGTGPGPAPRRRDLPARDVVQLRQEIAEAKRRLRLPADCPVVSCYEAGSRRLLAAPVSGRSRRAEPGGRFGEHRGQPSSAAGQE